MRPFVVCWAPRPTRVVAAVGGRPRSAASQCSEDATLVPPPSEQSACVTSDIAQTLKNRRSNQIAIEKVPRSQTYLERSA